MDPATARTVEAIVVVVAGVYLAYCWGRAIVHARSMERHRTEPSRLRHNLRLGPLRTSNLAPEGVRQRRQWVGYALRGLVTLGLAGALLILIRAFSAS